MMCTDDGTTIMIQDLQESAGGIVVHDVENNRVCLDDGKMNGRTFEFMSRIAGAIEFLLSETGWVGDEGFQRDLTEAVNADDFDETINELFKNKLILKTVINGRIWVKLSSEGNLQANERRHPPMFG